MPRTGRQKCENPKNIQVRIRFDKDSSEALKFCAEKLGMSKSDVIRMGIQKIKAEIEKK